MGIIQFGLKPVPLDGYMFFGREFMYIGIIFFYKFDLRGSADFKRNLVTVTILIYCD